MKRYNALVFGSTKAGKSSLINLLIGKLSAPVSSAAIGTTFEAKDYDCIHEGITFNFTDTAGLNEPNSEASTVKDSTAFENLLKLVSDHKEGFSILIFVFRQDGIKTETKQNYEIFKQFLNPEVPIICVVTGCEEEDDLDEWPSKNAKNFVNHGMNFSLFVGACCKQIEPGTSTKMIPIIKEARTKTHDKIFQAIKQKALEEPKFSLKTKSMLMDGIRRAWNTFALFVGLSHTYHWASETVIAFFQRNFPQDAVEKAKKFERDMMKTD